MFKKFNKKTKYFYCVNNPEQLNRLGHFLSYGRINYLICQTYGNQAGILVELTRVDKIVVKLFCGDYRIYESPRVVRCIRECSVN